MTPKALRESLKLWQARAARAEINHKRYVKLTRKSLEDSRFYKKRMARRVYWWRLYKKATENVKRRKAQLAAVDAVQVSRKGLDHIIREEGMIPYAYNDPAGHATFGVGHLIHHGPVTEQDKRVWGSKERPSSRQRVMDVLDSDLDRFEKVVREVVKVRLKQHEFDALLSLAFNIGTNGFAESSVVKHLNMGHKKAAADAFLNWSKPAMLRPRRERERNLFLTGKYQ